MQQLRGDIDADAVGQDQKIVQALQRNPASVLREVGVVRIEPGDQGVNACVGNALAQHGFDGFAATAMRQPGHAENSAAAAKPLQR